MKVLVDSKILENLKSLILKQTAVDDAGLKLLAEVNFKNLEILVLISSEMRDEGLKAFLSSQNFENLNYFDISETKITPEAFNMDLSVKFPKIECLIVPQIDSFREKLPERFRNLLGENSKIFEDLEEDPYL